MAAANTQTLLEEVKCYACYGGSIQQLLKLALLRRKLLVGSPSADVSAGALIEYAKCYGCYGASIMDLIELALLDQISQVVVTESTPQFLILSTDQFTPASATRITSSITPSANALILVCASSVGGLGTDLTGITGCGLTWVKINMAQGGGLGQTNACIYRALGPSPTTGALTLTYNAPQNGTVVSVYQFTGVPTSGTNGSGAIAQSAVAVGTAAANPSVNLAAFQVDGKSTGFFVATKGGAGATNPFAGTPESGWTESLDSGATGGATCGAYISYRALTTDNTMIVTAAAADFGIVGIEILPA